MGYSGGWPPCSPIAAFTWSMISPTSPLDNRLQLRTKRYPRNPNANAANEKNTPAKIPGQIVLPLEFPALAPITRKEKEKTAIAQNQVVVTIRTERGRAKLPVRDVLPPQVVNRPRKIGANEFRKNGRERRRTTRSTATEPTTASINPMRYQWRVRSFSNRAACSGDPLTVIDTASSPKIVANKRELMTLLGLSFRTYLDRSA